MDSSQKEEDCCSSEGLGSGETIKCCSDCKTTKTPLWRSGPSGPKSLCNACGIRYRKKRPTPVVAATATTTSSRKDEMKKGRMGKTRSLRDALKVNIIMPALEGGQISPVKGMKSPRQWGEVERAALLLMALSCGAVFA